ncbi:Inositol polyphosphate kinase family-containing protein [Strongyloides ratti]|uniref:Kinase n=1 Tax=Strongyloides ratti TaxID=34506 RepID=A0A090LAB9_STRRB|nr:Inositol polyphosphate kinase family-containing protein [Strongyloides ratti]CEF66686.1 Inositol polyphosphate kinase family-containing protein [Strongyloides ratti]
MEVTGFSHQVGGHFGMFCCNGHVCKPLNQREYLFYSSVDKTLFPYTAKFCGIGKLSINFTPSNNDENDTEIIGKKYVAMKSDIILDCHTSHFETNDQMRFIIDDSNKTIFAVGKNSNSWANQCQSKAIQKLVDSRNDKQFIFLEDIVSIYKKPCVVDLKMGTRQYGDHATAEKKASQTQKSESSTSGTLGVRIVGMQIWDQKEKKYYQVNKYEGREMTEYHFLETILHFFERAGQARRKVLFEKLTGLKKVLLNAEGFRFYSSSILIAFEGMDLEENKEDINDIDNLEEDITYTGYDEGYLLGVTYLINILYGYIIGGTTLKELIIKFKQINKDRGIKRELSEQEKLINSEDDEDEDENEDNNYNNNSNDSFQLKI